MPMSFNRMLLAIGFRRAPSQLGHSRGASWSSSSDSVTRKTVFLTGLVLGQAGGEQACSGTRWAPAQLGVVGKESRFWFGQTGAATRAGSFGREQLTDRLAFGILGQQAEAAFVRIQGPGRPAVATRPLGWLRPRSGHGQLDGVFLVTV